MILARKKKGSRLNRSWANIVSPIIVAIFLIAPLSAYANWPSPESKASWTTACSDSLRQQGHSNPSGMCGCVADAFELDYTAEEMARSLVLNPDPNGNSLEKRLYTTFVNCNSANP